MSRALPLVAMPASFCACSTFVGASLLGSVSACSAFSGNAFSSGQVVRRLATFVRAVVASEHKWKCQRTGYSLDAQSVEGRTKRAEHQSSPGAVCGSETVGASAFTAEGASSARVFRSITIPSVMASALGRTWGFQWEIGRLRARAEAV